MGIVPAFQRLFILSSLLLITSLASAQYVSEWSLDAIRVGVDPIKSLSMFLNPAKYKDRPYFFNYAEGYLELLIHLRTSAVFEAGYSSSYWNRYNNTFFYTSKGHYYRFGLDFNVSEPDPNYEFDLGWRIGFNSFTEKADIAMKGNYWGEHYNLSPLNSKGSAFWGEIALDMKYRIFKNSYRQLFSNLWFHISFRLKFKQKDQASQEGQYYLIPGYGLNSKFMPGLHFTLSYFIKIRERKVYRIHHVYDNKVLIHPRK